MHLSVSLLLLQLRHQLLNKLSPLSYLKQPLKVIISRCHASNARSSSFPFLFLCSSTERSLSSNPLGFLSPLYSGYLSWCPAHAQYSVKSEWWREGLNEWMRRRGKLQGHSASKSVGACEQVPLNNIIGFSLPCHPSASVGKAPFSAWLFGSPIGHFSFSRKLLIYKTQSLNFLSWAGITDSVPRSFSYKLSFVWKQRNPVSVFSTKVQFI